MLAEKPEKALIFTSKLDQVANIVSKLKYKNIDVAFLPVNQPFTMTVKQAVNAARIINPKILYPYHYGQTEQVTDLDQLCAGLEGSGIEVRLREMP